MKKGRLLFERKFPNLVCLCIDKNQAGEIGGRIYNPYNTEPESFENVVQMLRSLELFYDRICFPQSSVQLRGFIKEDTWDAKEEADLVEQLDEESLLEKKGGYATFLVAVKFRQNATWQGELYWVEEKRQETFKSVLELLILIDNILIEGKEKNSRERWKKE